MGDTLIFNEPVQYLAISLLSQYQCEKDHMNIKLNFLVKIELTNRFIAFQSLCHCP